MALPVIDVSPFFTGDEDGMKLATEQIGTACKIYGCFRMINHGIPPELMARAFDLSKRFFSLPEEEKRKVQKQMDKSTRPAGYEHLPGRKNEYFVVYSPHLELNAYPDEEFKTTVEECFSKLRKSALLVQEILNKSMGLPPNFLKEYNNDGVFDIMTINRFLPLGGTDDNNIALGAHQDGNCVTFVFQDDVAGLEVLSDGKWIPVDPDQGRSIVVNLGDIIQVLSNNKFKSAKHRVVQQPTYRHSFALFLNVDGEKWIEPLPQFTTDIGEAPAYRGFYNKEYLKLRVLNNTHPPADPKDKKFITHYAI